MFLFSFSFWEYMGVDHFLSVSLCTETSLDLKEIAKSNDNEKSFCM